MQKRVLPVFLTCALAVLFVGALALLTRSAVPIQAAPLAQTCIPVQQVILSGPTTVITGTYFNFTAALSPTNTTPVFHYWWQITDQAPISALQEFSISNTQEFAWITPGLKTVQVVGQSHCQSEPVTVTMQVVVAPLGNTDVPMDAYRRALQHLEEQRLSGMSPEWAQARLGEIQPLYRPDMAEPAYYEFAVITPGAGGLSAAAIEPAGFIVVSAAEHDYPIPHWATAGQPPTQRMRQQAAAQGKTAIKFFKLDTLAYAAQDANGQRVATDGNQPHKIIGYDPNWRTRPAPLTETSWSPRGIVDDPASGEVAVEYNLTVSGSLTSTLQFVGWDSWEQLKEEYAETYEPFLETLRQHAGEAWQVENNSRQYGHAMFKGDTWLMPLLWPTPTLTFSGPGLPLVDTALITPTGLLPRLLITATDMLPGQVAPLTIAVDYANGMHETVLVQIVARHQVYLPLALREADGQTATPASWPLTSAGDLGSDLGSDLQAQDMAPGIVGTDGYTYWFAGGSNLDQASNNQCWYQQMPASDPINTSDCKSGCGPTAWAMLIGWGDRQAASGTSNLWAGRWGLYRVNGGRGNDAVAPTAWGDVGVKNMTWEINRAVGTWCNAFNDNGATSPWDMIDVIDYLNGRSGMEVKTWYLPTGFDPFGYSEQDLVKYARNVIRNPAESARPSIIGTGFFSHYPLAYGYREKPIPSCWQQCDWQGCKSFCITYYTKGFLVNQGWGNTKEWVAADIFFTGRLGPHKAYVDDVALYRASNRYWYFDHQHDGTQDDSHAPFGWSEGVRPVVGDFDRDKVLDDKAVFIYSHDNISIRYDWSFDYNNNRTMDKYLDRWVYTADAWPIALDYDRDGYVDDLGVYISPLKTWRWNIDHQREGSSDGLLDWGFTGDERPVSGDFDRDGYHDDIALFSPSTGMWRFDFDHNGTTDATSGPWGTPDDLPVAGDFDGDGYVDDIGLFNKVDRKWRYDYNYNATNLNQTDKMRGPFGSSGDLPVSGNFDTR